MENIAPNIFEDGQSLEKALSISPIDTYTNYAYQDLFEHNTECKTCENRFKCSGFRTNALAYVIKGGDAENTFDHADTIASSSKEICKLRNRKSNK